MQPQRQSSCGRSTGQAVQGDSKVQAVYTVYTKRISPGKTSEPGLHLLVLAAGWRRCWCSFVHGEKKCVGWGLFWPLEMATGTNKIKHQQIAFLQVCGCSELQWLAQYAYTSVLRAIGQRFLPPSASRKILLLCTSLEESPKMRRSAHLLIGKTSGSGHGRSDLRRLTDPWLCFNESAICLFHDILWHLMISHDIWWRLMTSKDILWHLVTSCDILSHLITSYHILSHLTPDITR